MNNNPNALALAIVHQVVQSSQLEETLQQLEATQKRAQELQQAIDALVADREQAKKAHAAREAELTELANANAEALADVAKFYDFPSVDALLASIKPAPAPVVESEGGEAG